MAAGQTGHSTGRACCYWERRQPIRSGGDGGREGRRRDDDGNGGRTEREEKEEGRGEGEERGKEERWRGEIFTDVSAGQR